MILENGKPSVQLDGVNDNLTFGNVYNAATSATAFTVFKASLASSVDKNTLWDIGSVDDTHLKYFNGITYDGFSSTVRKSWTDTYSYNLHTLISVISKNNLYEFYANTLLRHSTTTNTFNTKSTNIIGKGPNPSFFQGKIQELILYPSDQSSNRTGIETNIANHYGITLSL